MRMIKNSSNAEPITLGEVRSRLVDKALVLFGILSVPALLLSLYRITYLGWRFLFLVHILAVIGVILSAIFRKRLPYVFRALTIIILWGIVGLVGVLYFGLISGGVTILICMSFAVTVAFGWRQGLWISGFFSLFMIVMGILVSNGLYTFDFDFNEVMSSASSWQMNSLVIIIWAPTTVLGFGIVIQYLVDSLELLRQSRTAYQQIFNGVTDAIFVHDSDTGVVVDVNEQMLTMYGCSREDVLHQDVLKFSTGVPPYDLVHIQKHLSRVDNNNAEPVTFEWHAKKKDGTLFWASVTLKRLTIGGTSRIIAVVRDINEQKMAHELLIQSEKMMSVGGLAAGMAHEINNPLGGMLQTLQVLSARLLEPLPANVAAANEAGIGLETLHKYMDSREVPRMLNNLNIAGNRAAQIVANMLNFARKSDLSMGYTNLVELVEQTLNIVSTDYDLKKSYDFKQIHINRRYDKTMPSVKCEAGKIQQVLFNILRNGAEAMHEYKNQMNDRTPTFTVDLKNIPHAQMVQLSITDNGPGIPKAMQKHVFEPFFTTKRVGQGTGLGLSVSYFIITHDHGGEMSVESIPGEGTSFIILLPIVPPSEKEKR